MIHNKDADVRAWVAKALAFNPYNEGTIDFLCQLATDNDPDVRVEAIDTISAFPHIKAYSVLQNALTDSDVLVRAYAAFGVAHVGQIISTTDARSRLQILSQTEKNERVMVSVYEGLYILGMESMLQKLCALFFSPDYHVQCCVIHALEEIVNSSNNAQITAFFNSIDFSTYPIAVSEAAKSLKAELSRYND